MIDWSRFDDIRPYDESEIPAAMQRIAANNAFMMAAKFIYPDKDIEEVRSLVRSITNTSDLQTLLMKDAVETIIAQSTAGFTYSGIEKLDRQTNYLFVSNHRDIALDAMLLQYALVVNGFDTSEITFGANLMSNQFIIDIGKANKMFRVERPGLSITSPRAFYESMCRLSDYIRNVITQKRQSVWIAQRNGRTKDGLDRTDPAIIKMFGMSFPEDKVKALEELHIVPLSISYEFEPCAQLKVLEMYESSKIAYSKKPGEDLFSIISGIMAPKGRVHLSICDPLTLSDYLQFAQSTASVFNKSVSSLIDERICRAYRLYPNNYIAHDILYGNSEFASQYSPQQKESFVSSLSVLEKYDAYSLEELKELYLGLYSNPVDSVSMFGGMPG